MPTTIPGGAYVRVNLDGSESWFDAEGAPLSIKKVSEAKKMLSARARQLEADENARLSLEAQRNPTAQAIAAALAPKPAAAPKKTAAPDPVEDDEDDSDDGDDGEGAKS